MLPTEISKLFFSPGLSGSSFFGRAGTFFNFFGFTWRGAFCFETSQAPRLLRARVARLLRLLTIRPFLIIKSLFFNPPLVCFCRFCQTLRRCSEGMFYLIISKFKENAWLPLEMNHLKYGVRCPKLCLRLLPELCQVIGEFAYSELPAKRRCNAVFKLFELENNVLYHLSWFVYVPVNHWYSEKWALRWDARAKARLLHISKQFKYIPSDCSLRTLVQHFRINCIVRFSYTNCEALWGDKTLINPARLYLSDGPILDVVNV